MKPIHIMKSVDPADIDPVAYRNELIWASESAIDIMDLQVDQPIVMAINTIRDLIQFEVEDDADAGPSEQVK